MKKVKKSDFLTIEQVSVEGIDKVKNIARRFALEHNFNFMVFENVGDGECEPDYIEVQFYCIGESLVPIIRNSYPCGYYIGIKNEYGRISVYPPQWVAEA